MNNSWSWFDDKKNLRQYEFQTMLDILSFAENLPLRVMDYDALCRVNIAELWYLNDEHNTETLEDIKKQSHKFCQHVKTLFTDIKKLQDNPEYHQDTDKFEIAFQKILNKNKKINPPPAFNALKNNIDPLIELEKSVWHNQPSNPLPVHSLFRHCEEWRWWVFFWFFCEREKLKAIASSNNHFSGDAFFMDSWEFYIQWITLDESDKKYLLVVGPIYKEQGLNSTTKQFYIRYGKTLKLCYKAFHKCYTKGSLTHLAHDDIIRRMVHAQLLPLSKQEVKKRVSSIKAILRMLQVALTKNRQPDYSYHDIYTITYYLIFLERMSSILESGEYVFHFSFSYPEQNGILSITIQVDKSKLNGERITNITITENCQEKPKTNYPLQSFEYSLDTEEKQIQQFDNQKIESFNSKIEYWNETYDVRRKAAQEIHIALLGEWLKNHYGSLDEENKDSSKNTRFYNYICHNILNWVRADECNLFRFKHAQQAIDLIGHVTLAKLGEKWNSEKITKEINELNNKEDSAVFRAISNNKNIFIPENNPNNPQFYISPSYTTDCSPRSCMIVPITFQGRIYGALEVIGFSDYQFQWSHELIFTNVAHLIANYIYSQQMLFALQEITRLALQSSGVAQTVKNEKNGAYTPLCEQLSKIFLSKCANLWIKDSTNHHIYSFRGNTHATLFNGCEHEFNINENRNYVASYLIDQYVKQGKTYVVGSVDTGIDVSHFDENQQLYIIGNDSPDTKLRNIIINDLKAKELLVFLLINERRQDNNNREQNILGFVTLFNPKFLDYSDNWQNIINLVREQLVITLRTLDSEAKGRKTDEAMLMHEIKQDAWTLYRAIKRIETHFREFEDHALQVDLKRDMSAFQLQWQNRDNNERGNFVNNFMTLFNSIQSLMKTWKKKLKPSLNGLPKAVDRLHYKLNLYEQNKSIRLDILYGEDAPDFNDIPYFIDLLGKCAEIRNSRIAVAKQKGCDIDIQIKPYYSIKMQCAMLNNFILNLIDNSVKYANPNSTIELVFFKTENSYRLQIKNYAPAISDNEKDIDLFALGVRTEKARKQDRTGDGVGLYIIACICDFHRIRYSYDKPKALQGEYIFNFDFPIDYQNPIVKIESGYKR